MLMIAPLILQAVTGSLLSPQDVQDVFAADDYPPAALARGEQGATAIQVITRPDGTVDSCKVVVSSGHPELDMATCPIVRERAIFNSPRGAHGKPVYGAFRSVVTWSIGAPNPVGLGPDLELQINQAPAGASLPLVFPVSYLMESNGTMSDCRLSQPAPAAPQVLVDLACRTLSQSSLPVIHNRNGKAVDARNEARVKFSVGG